MIDQIDQIFRKEYFHLLSAFSIDMKTNELDEAILNSIFKAQIYGTRKDLKEKIFHDDEKNLLECQLKIALESNLIQVAKKHIFDKDVIEVGLLKETMYTAIDKNRPDFVKEFLNNGFKLSKYLTYRILLKLYNDVSRSSPFYNLFMRRKLDKYSLVFNRIKTDDVYIRFKDVGLILKELLGNSYRNEYLKEPYDQLTTSDAFQILSQTDDYGQVRFIRYFQVVLK